MPSRSLILTAICIFATSRIGKSPQRCEICVEPTLLFHVYFSITRQISRDDQIYKSTFCSIRSPATILSLMPSYSSPPLLYHCTFTLVSTLLQITISIVPLSSITTARSCHLATIEKAHVTFMCQQQHSRRSPTGSSSRAW